MINFILSFVGGFICGAATLFFWDAGWLGAFVSGVLAAFFVVAIVVLVMILAISSAVSRDRGQ